jgi:hypothetical protein
MTAVQGGVPSPRSPPARQETGWSVVSLDGVNENEVTASPSPMASPQPISPPEEGGTGEGQDYVKRSE